MNVAEIVQDQRRRYEHTYVLVNMPGETEDHVFFCDAVIPDADHGAVLQLSSTEFGKITLNLSTGHTLKFEYPKAQVFQFEREAYIFRRNPIKQYRRGLCPDNALFLTCTDSMVARSLVTWSKELVTAAYDGDVYSPEEALKMLAGGKYKSVALGNGFIITQPLTSKKEEFPVFFLDMPVARVAPNKVVMDAEAFTQQIEQMFL